MRKRTNKMKKRRRENSVNKKRGREEGEGEEKDE